MSARWQNQGMTESSTITVFEDVDGILLFGTEKALAVLDSETETGLVSRKLSARSLSKAGQALSIVGEVQAHSALSTPSNSGMSRSPIAVKLTPGLTAAVPERCQN